MINIYVINLKHRTDKIKEFKSNFSKYFNIIVIDAIKEEEGWKGCLYSHLKCIKYAKENNLKYIIVFEDDACPKYKDWFEKFKNIKEQVFDTKNDWDIFIGGSTKTYKKHKISKYDLENNLYRVCKTQNTHSIVYNHTCYDFFLNCNQSKPIDLVWHNQIKCIMSIPFLFTVKNFVSDISKEWNKLSDKINDNEKKLLEYI
jgi:hypothetical protein